MLTHTRHGIDIVPRGTRKLVRLAHVRWVDIPRYEPAGGGYGSQARIVETCSRGHVDIHKLLTGWNKAELNRSLIWFKLIKLGLHANDISGRHCTRPAKRTNTKENLFQKVRKVN